MCLVIPQASQIRELVMVGPRSSPRVCLNMLKSGIAYRLVNVFQVYSAEKPRLISLAEAW